MAKLLILSVLLSTIIFPAAAFWSGCKFPGSSLQKFCSSSVDHWSGRMRDVAQGLSFPNMPGGLLSCRADILTCTSVRVDLIHPIGLDVNVFLDTGLRCKLAGIDVRLLVTVCVKVHLRVKLLALAVDGCAVVDVKLQLPLLPVSINAAVVADVITRVLNDPCCVRARTVCHELNYVYDFDDDDVPIPFPPTCTTTFKRHKPHISSRDLDFPCSSVVKCGVTEYSFPVDPDFSFPSVTTSGDVIFFISEVHLNAMLGLWRTRFLFDSSITLTSVTTSTLKVHVSEISVSGSHICVIRVTCLAVNVVLIPGRATLHITLQLTVGYQGSSSFVTLLRLTLKVAMRLHLRIDCSRRLIVLYVTDDISVWELSGSCSSKPCSIQFSELAVALGLRVEIVKILNVQLKIGFPWPLFKVYGCDSCSEAVCIKDGFYWPCKMRYPVF